MITNKSTTFFNPRYSTLDHRQNLHSLRFRDERRSERGNELIIDNKNIKAFVFVAYHICPLAPERK